MKCILPLAWLQLIMFACTTLSISAGLAAYHFHLLHVIRSAHKEVMVTMALNTAFCLVVILVVGKIIWRFKYRNILPHS